MAPKKGSAKKKGKATPVTGNVIRNCCVRLARVKLPEPKSNVNTEYDTDAENGSIARKVLRSRNAIQPEVVLRERKRNNAAGASKENDATDGRAAGNSGKTETATRRRKRAANNTDNTPNDEPKQQKQNAVEPEIATRGRKAKPNVTAAGSEPAIGGIRIKVLTAKGLAAIEKGSGTSRSSKAKPDAGASTSKQRQPGTPPASSSSKRGKKASAAAKPKENAKRVVAAKTKSAKASNAEHQQQQQAKGQNLASKQNEAGSNSLISANNQPTKQHKLFLRNAVALPQRESSRTSTHAQKDPYDFLSSSKTSSSSQQLTRPDSADDVVKKLIKEGKVRVATKWKGRGRPRIKPIAKKKRENKPGKSKANKKPTPSSKPPVSSSPIYEPEYNYCLAVSDDEDVIDEFIVEPPVSPEPLSLLNTPDGHRRKSKNATYSAMARSALINEASNASRLITTRDEMLQALQRCSKNTQKATSNAFVSSTPRTKTNVELGSKSPWRVPDTSTLPDTFFFGRSAANLPSFSSDFISPAQQGGAHEQNASHDSSDVISQNFEIGNEQFMDSANVTQSDTENVPPSTPIVVPTSKPNLDLTVGEKSNDEAELIHLPNPFKGQPTRMPLQPIQILEVITLPPYKKAADKPEEQPIGTAIERSSSPARCESDNSKLFGFEEFLSDSQLDDNDGSIGIGSSNGSSSIHNRLKDLRKLRPPVIDDQRPCTSRQAKLRRDYDDLAAGLPRQRKVNEMLSSTAVAHGQQTISKPLATEVHEEFSWPAQLEESSFDKKAPHRTYAAEFRKRPRRCKAVKFAQQSDDESNEDDEHDDVLKTPRQAQKKKQRAKRDDNKKGDDAEVEKFASEFNAICDEVDRYELIVE